jgi:uncharacterized protein
VKRIIASFVANWRLWVLAVLLVGPILAYIVCGALWLAGRGWLFYASALWVGMGIVFAALASRWTKSQQAVLPPIDWDVPSTFAPRDRSAWELVQAQADEGETRTTDELSRFDVYIEVGRRLAERLAAHYHPLSTDPLDHVPFVELLSAMELAAEDLDHLCRQVPGGDLVTPAHWKRAMQAAEYLNWANEIYTYLLPVFQPVPGLVRLGTQRLMVKPAWRNMQQNLLRWFYRAYVNRLGMHLIELFSGRLAIGADQYRRLVRKRLKPSSATQAAMPPLTIAFAGARDTDKTALIAALEQARTTGLGVVEGRLAAAGFDENLAERLRTAQWVELPRYTATPGRETARDRSTRRAAAEAAQEADMLLLVIDGSRDDISADVSFAQAWDRWYTEHPGAEVPPALAIVTGADRPAQGGGLEPPHDWTHGRATREVAVRARLEAIRTALPPTLTDVIAVGIGPRSSYGVNESVLPAIASLLHRADRAALIRVLQRTSARSKAGRLLGQVGRQGKRLWHHLRRGAMADGR